MKRMSLDLLHEEISDCHKCELHKDDNIPQLATYNENAKIFMVAHGPKNDELYCNNYFETQSGRYLKKLLEQANMKPDDIYFAHIVRCFSVADNKKIPEKSLQACRGWLWKELTIQKPKVIITLGHRPTNMMLVYPKSKVITSYIGDILDVGYTNSKIAPWYDIGYVLSRGKALDDRTIEFLQKVNKYANEAD